MPRDFESSIAVRDFLNATTKAARVEAWSVIKRGKEHVSDGEFQMIIDASAARTDSVLEPFARKCKRIILSRQDLGRQQPAFAA